MSQPALPPAFFSTDDVGRTWEHLHTCVRVCVICYLLASDLLFPPSFLTSSSK